MARKLYSKKRRAIMAKGDDINHLLVFERDGWICNICGEIIDRRLRGDSWWRATLDHVIPLSRGGTHTWDNLAAAHWICNMKKGNSISDAVKTNGLTCMPDSDIVVGNLKRPHRKARRGR